MKKPSKARKRTRKTIASAEKIAAAAERGENVTRFFTGKGKMMPGLPREQKTKT